MNLVPLFEEALEFQNYNGTVLSNGKVAVFYIGRTRLADIFNDIEGLSPAENPRILDNLGMGPIYVNPAFDYEMVVYDAYDNELFSVKKYVLSKGEHSTANVVVTPSEHIAVSAWTIGDVQVYMPYLVGEVGKTYEGILPIVVNNDVNRISAQHIPLGVQDPLYFVEDSETACIIGCSAQTEIPAELSGKWDEASDAVIANSAQWAEGTEYEAGSYIDIDGHTISVTGLQPEGDYAYNSALSSKLDVTALPQDLVHSGDLTAYYPSDNPSGFITGVDLTDYATTAQLDEKLDKSDSGNFYPMEGNPSGFLTAHQSLQGYATEQWVEDKGYITGVEIPESATWNATTETVSSNSAQWGASNPQIPVTGINGIKISESGDQVVFEVSGDYYPGNNPSGFITGVDLSDYATTAQVAEKQDSLTFGYHDTAISSIDNSAIYDNSAHARINTLAGRISDLSSNKLDTTAFSDVSGTFLTAHQDLSDYQTTAGMTAYQPAGDYLTTADSAEFYTTANESGFITGVDLTPYQLTADMTAYQPVGDYLTTADSANFYTTANESGYITGVPDTYLQNTDLSTTDGKVTAISGIPLSAGGDVPEGVMVESGLEFNAVNEISAYNGSAIAQYGAEKQWLVHDDTLVHLSNSAQYALGVNVSALQRLLGIDETVLWEGTDPLDQSCLVNGTRETATLSEPLSSFNKIRIYAVWNPWIGNFTGCNTFEYPGSNQKGGYIMNDCTNQGYIAGGSWSASGTTFKLIKHWQAAYPTAKETNNGLGGIFKVVGIGRKQ